MYLRRPGVTAANYIRTRVEKTCSDVIRLCPDIQPRTVVQHQCLLFISYWCNVMTWTLDEHDPINLLTTYNVLMTINYYNNVLI